MYTKLFLIIAVCLFAIPHCTARTAEEWKDRILYQIITDRFGSTNNNIAPCTDLSDYCGGTFKGIEKNLDYIQGMGINAIWISPVIQNAPGGYHGYWHTNFYAINEHFGTKEELQDLIKACHERDIYIMIDVVPNHVAEVADRSDFSGIYPFNDTAHYHWPVYKCQDIDRDDPTNQTAIENCWLSYLPDLNHENEFVTNTLIEWVRDFVATYDVDGLRLDATRHVPKWFWYEFTKAAGVFTVGEVWNYDTAYVGRYQGPIDSLLNFPLHGPIDQAYHNFSADGMLIFEKYFQEDVNEWPNKDVILNFLNNHDMPRYLYETPDMAHYKSAYLMAMCSVGIPIIYYGDEQNFNGGKDPLNRESLWGLMDENSDMYQFFKTVNSFRLRTKFYRQEQIQRLADQSLYAFSRGDAFFAFTNAEGVQTRVIESHPYPEGTILCNILGEQECV